MLFSKNMEPRCEYCRHGVTFDGDELIGCKHHGVMRADDKCRRFTYDPLKRVPDPPRVFKAQEFDKEDFEL
jgi:hypothetical protein